MVPQQRVPPRSGETRVSRFFDPAATPRYRAPVTDTESIDQSPEAVTDEADDTATPPPSEPAPDAPSRRRERPLAPALPPRRRWLGVLSYSLPGSWVAVVFVCLTFTPSLLPRTAVFQGLVSGITGAIGYGLGVLGAWIWRQFADRPERPAQQRSWLIFSIGGGVLLIGFLIYGLIMQFKLRDLMGAEPLAEWTLILLPIVGAVAFALIILISRGFRRLFRWLATLLSHWMGVRAARVIGWAVVLVLVWSLISGVLIGGIISVTDAAFATRDNTTPDGAVQPTDGSHSGGPGSLIGWDTLGYQGRAFIGKGPTVAQLSAFKGGVAKEPIRAYAGIQSAADVEERARLAVADLDRAGGFSRAYLLVAGTTGTGWVDPANIDSLEYETGGDIASVAIQYSYLPSWASVVVDKERAAEAGRALFDAVYEHWISLPAATRPMLLISGESLGSYSMESNFSGEYDLSNRVNGALFAGAPGFNPLHTQFTDERDAGSPMIEPVFQNGRIVRFSTDPSQPIKPTDQPWTGTRVLYLQNPSDAVVWNNTNMILHKPDWLREPPGEGVLPQMTWIPFVTFWQVAADMIEPVDTPDGTGHQYTGAWVDGWAAVIQPDGWTSQKADQLRTIIRAGG